MASTEEIDHILCAYSECDQSDIEVYLSKLRDCRNGVKKSLRAEFQARADEDQKMQLRRPGDRHGLTHWVNSRDELYQLDEEERHLTIVNMAMVHYVQELKAGHVVNHRKTSDFAHHPIPEVDAYIFRTKCPPYDYHGMILPEGDLCLDNGCVILSE